MTLLTIIGWLTQFLISVRHGDPKQVGYIASVYWAGFTAGRVVLADITHQLGERRMVAFYMVLALAMQILFWLVPNILANAITICVFGGFSRICIFSPLWKRKGEKD